MTNREFYKEQILDIACKGKNIGFDTRTNKLCACEELDDCHNCLFCAKYSNNCEVRVEEWCNEEHAESCPFEDGELVEVSNDEVNWRLRYFSHMDKNSNIIGNFVTYDIGMKDPMFKSHWEYCRKYGTLGGLVKGEEDV